jgi:hypothetical protein
MHPHEYFFGGLSVRPAFAFCSSAEVAPRKRRKTAPAVLDFAGLSRPIV